MKKIEITDDQRYVYETYFLDVHKKTALMNQPSVPNYLKKLTLELLQDERVKKMFEYENHLR